MLPEKANETLVVNFFAGPGAGKSTLSRAVSAELSMRGYLSEYVPEYAKDLTWEKRYKTFEDQIYIFGKQLHRFHRLLGQVTLFTTDSPLLNSIVYGDQIKSNYFKPLVLETFNSMNNLNIFLNRVKKYEPKGRNQTEEESKQLDNKIKDILDMYKIPYIEFEGKRENVEKISNIIEKLIN